MLEDLYDAEDAALDRVTQDYREVVLGLPARPGVRRG